MVVVGTKPVAVQAVSSSRCWYILRVETRGFSEKLYGRCEGEDDCNSFVLTSMKKLSNEAVKTTSEQVLEKRSFLDVSPWRCSLDIAAELWSGRVEILV